MMNPILDADPRKDAQIAKLKKVRTVQYVVIGVLIVISFFLGIYALYQQTTAAKMELVARDREYSRIAEGQNEAARENIRQQQKIDSLSIQLKRCHENK